MVGHGHQIVTSYVTVYCRVNIKSKRALMMGY